MDEMDLLIDLHLRQHRQGPGGDDETRRAIELARLPTSQPLRIADIGCGTGASTLLLARLLNHAQITAIDAALPLIEALRERAERAGFDNRITARIESMQSLSFADASLDVIWAEGSIYNMGFEPGIRAWRRFLRPGGVLAVTEITWLTAERPTEVESHWTTEYPGIGTASANIAVLERAGFRILGAFVLPSQCWQANFYEPLRAELPRFIQRHAGPHEAMARSIVAAEEREINLYEQFGQWYGYMFYIAQRLA